MNSTRYLAASLLVCLLASCASIAPQNSSGLPNTTTRTYQEKVDLNGRLSILYQRNGKDEALHGSFVWSQTPARTEVTLLTPLGQTVANIDITPDGARLQQSGDKPPRTAANVDDLVTGTLGWPLPISGLRTWLQGFGTAENGKPYAASPQMSDVTTRDGWHIHYVSWQGDGPAYPKRIDLDRQTAQAGNVSIRIVIDTWQQ